MPAAGDLQFSWLRRKRIDGDTWSGTEVPLGEEREAYLVRVMRGGAILREAEVGAPAWTYSAAMQVEDGPGAVESAVAQVPDRFRPGPFRSLGTAS